MAKTQLPLQGEQIAIVGMAAHLPGAADIDEYWTMLRDGQRAIRRMTEEELIAAREPLHRIRAQHYVPFAAPLKGYENFDGEFFGFSPKESAILDPQHRRFLEAAWEALENAGHVPSQFEGPIGVFGGCGMGSYFYFNLCSNPDLVDEVGMFLLRHTGNDKDFLTTRVSHVFDLKGPSIGVQTACSTSLVATHMAAQALLNGECDMALAGGVTIEIPQGRGYLYKEGEILSPDGECHAFDHRAQGTVFGSGAGVVVLRRLEDALADGDHIWATIRASAVNNDGSAKAGYLAPSVDGQAAAVAEAIAMAGISAETLDYIECHGTGTYLGDPIEIAALTEAFRETTEATGFCRIGSVKTNIGHLDTAAGVASLIKASLALHHGEMPPSLGYEAPNPSIDFETSPFVVNDSLRPWMSHAGPRRAGVNSLGVGGTNAHVVLEEAPARAASEESDWPFELLTLSARSTAALDAASTRLAEHLDKDTETPLADVAWTLAEGRHAFERRRVTVAESAAEAAEQLRSGNVRRVFTHTAMERPDVVFMFPGGGAQYAGMARDLYESEPVFRDWMDKGLAILERKIDYDLRALWLPEAGAEAAANAALQKPSVQLPLIMICEYALAELWQSWGVAPAALIGHSMGENTAACVAGVMSFEDCIGLVHLRGTLFDTVPPGGMLSVPLPAEQLRPWLGEALDLAAENAPGLSVASGPAEALDDLAARLAKEGIEAQRIPINIAAHSRMLEPILADFRAYLESIQLTPPRLTLISNRSGEALTAAEATDPDYWVAHLRGTVRFADGLSTLAERTERIYLEVGPGKTLSSLATAHDAISANQVIGSLRHADDPIADDKYFMAMLGRIWAAGGNFDWEQIWGGARRNRVVLPSYAFQRAPYYIAPGTATAEDETDWPLRLPDMADWGWRPSWVPRYAETDPDLAADPALASPRTMLLLRDEAGLLAALAERLRAGGHHVIEVATGDGFARRSETLYTLAPERGREGYDRLISDLAERDLIPDLIVNGWPLTTGEGHRPGSSFFHRMQEQGFYALLFLAQALAAEDVATPVQITTLTTGAERVGATPLRFPAKATIAGPARVIPREMPGITTATLDIDAPEATRRGLATEASRAALLPRLMEELLAPPRSYRAALRGDRRYEEAPRALPLPAPEAPQLAQGARVLITGGFGGIGLTLAETMIRDSGAHVTLLAREHLPPEADWPKITASRAPQDKLVRRITAMQHLQEIARVAGRGSICAEAADVTVLEDMRAALTRITDAGPLTGVIHAAGVIDDAPLLSKTSAGIEEVLAPKLHGTLVLDALFPDGALEWFVLFSSSSTTTAPAGQVDYVAANAYLNAYAEARADDKTRVLALNWGVWAEVGMAAEATADRRGALPEAPKESCTAPLLSARSFDPTGNRRFEAQFTGTDWIMDEHRTGSGLALLPGTGYLDLAASALMEQGERLPVTIRDLTFLRPLTLPEDGPADARLTLERSDLGYDLRIESLRRADGQEGLLLHAEAVLDLLPAPAPMPLNLDALRDRLGPMTEGKGGATLPSAQAAHMRFGPRWDVLRATALGAHEGLAQLTLPDAYHGDLDAGHLLHPALLDIATGWAMDLIDGYDGADLWVPMSYGAVTLYRALPAEIWSHVRSAAENRQDQDVAVFDVTLCDADGTICAEISRFAIRRLTGALALPPLRASDLHREGHAADAPLSPQEERLHHTLEQGIPPSDGPAAFFRALATGRPEVTVSSLDLPTLVTQAGRSERTRSTDRFERPELEQDYTAPEGEIETRLAGFWEELLGVAQVGADDSFFDLGGHSLIAVRLFAMIKKAYHVEFPISVLFEAPTIRATARLIEERIGPQDSAPGDTPKAPRRRFTHLVPMHDGEGGSRRPFFLVAGMFGNVLNLRHLAGLLGSDRPFYGVQARGLYGEDTPHRDLVEAARDYLAELRQVQPHGPYLLGGFSGGGITAYEMARQLTEAGEEVALLVMLDTPLPQRRPLTTGDRARIQMQSLQTEGPRYLIDWAKRRMAWEIEKRRNRDETTAEEEGTFHDAAIEAAFYEAIARYKVHPWDGPVRLYRPPLRAKWQGGAGRLISDERSYLTPDNDWGGYLSDLKVVEVPGDHDSMVLEPNVRVLARAIRGEIEAAERLSRQTEAAE